MPADNDIVLDLIRNEAHNNQEMADLFFLVGSNPTLCDRLKKNEVMMVLRAGLSIKGTTELFNNGL